MRRRYGQIVQWGLERLYHELAWSYDLVAAAVSGGYWAQWARAALPTLEPGLTLELGCGTGYVQQALALRGWPGVGLDRAAPMLRQAQARLASQGLSRRLVRADARAVPLADGSCANVVATFPAPYILAAATLGEIRRVLRPGGQLVMIDQGLLLGDGAYIAAVELAHRAMLQHGTADPRPALLRAAGFAVSEEWVRVGQSEVWRLRARVAQ